AWYSKVTKNAVESRSPSATPPPSRHWAGRIRQVVALNASAKKLTGWGFSPPHATPRHATSGAVVRRVEVWGGVGWREPWLPAASDARRLAESPPTPQAITGHRGVLGAPGTRGTTGSRDSRGSRGGRRRWCGCRPSPARSPKRRQTPSPARAGGSIQTRSSGTTLCIGGPATCSLAPPPDGSKTLWVAPRSCTPTVGMPPSTAAPPPARWPAPSGGGGPGEPLPPSAQVLSDHDLEADGHASARAIG